MSRRAASSRCPTPSRCSKSSADRWRRHADRADRVVRLADVDRPLSPRVRPFDAAVAAVTPVVDLMRRRWILAALMMTMMLAAMDITIVSTAIPQIVGDLGGFAQFGWVFSIFLLAQTITIPIYGKLADMFGRKPVLL